MGVLALQCPAPTHTSSSTAPLAHPQKQQRAYYYLWQLYHLSQDADAAQAQLAEAQVGSGSSRKSFDQRGAATSCCCC